MAFVLGNPNSWVVKVGSSSVGISSFNNALRSDRQVILSTTNSPEALAYLESNKFKKDVLNRLVNKLMIKKLQDDFGVMASKDILFRAIAKDPNFKNDSGKFDRSKFQAFLRQNGFNEERYVDEISNEVASAMVLETLSLALPVNHKMVIRRSRFNTENRFADVITVDKSDVNLKKIKVSNGDIKQYYEQNKQLYIVPELRKISYLSFSKKDFAKDFKISDKEIFANYEKNKAALMEPEKRSFYQVVFDEKAQAQDFADKLRKKTANNKSKISKEFAKMAKKLKNKSVKQISINKIEKRSMIKGLAQATFALAKNEISAPLESPLGFHVFLVNKITKSRAVPFSEVKKDLKNKMLENREEQVLQQKLAQIDDILLETNSLKAVAKKLGVKAVKSVVIDAKGNDKNGKIVKKIQSLQQFAENSFLLKEGQVSKSYFSKDSDGFYILKLQKITATRQKRLSEV